MIYNFFGNLDDFNLLFNAPFFRSQTHENVCCPQCQINLYEFSKTGKLGCSRCYETFRPHLTSVLESIHANTTHTGKVPATASARLKIKRELQSLTEQLQKAVAQQDFEQAAVLRDKIKALNAEEGL